MFRIQKSFNFEASHQLTGLPADHKCSKHHGHSYLVILTLEGKNLNKVGFLRDYRELDSVKNWIDETLDHRHLNDVLPTNPTAEFIAYFIFNRFQPEIPELVSVTIKETAKTSATYDARQ